MPGIDQPAEETTQANPVLAFVVTVDILITHRIVELLSLCVYNHVIIRLFPKVYLGPLYIEVTNRGYILYQQIGQPLSSDLIYRAEGNTVAMGKLQAAVDPRLCLSG